MEDYTGLGSDSMYDPSSDNTSIQRALLQAALLRKQAVAPQGTMVSGIYVKPSMGQQLLPLVNNLVADYKERTADEKQKQVTQQSQQALQAWMAGRPTDKTVYGAGDEGPTMTTQPVTDAQTSNWAARGLANPLTKTLASKVLEDQIVQAPIRAEKAADKKELAQMMNERFADDRDARKENVLLQLQQRAAELQGRISIAEKNNQNTTSLRLLQNQVQERIQQMKGDQKLEQIKAATGSEGGAAGMTPEAEDSAAQTYRMTGALPSFGMGAAGQAAKIRILNKAAAMDAGAGATPQDSAQLKIDNKSAASALAQIDKQKTMVGAFERNFNSNADLLRKQALKVDNTGVPIVNKWINAGKRAVEGDPELSAFDVGVKAVVNEYSKIISGSMGNQALAEGEIKKVEGLLNSAQTPQQLKSVLDYMQVETQNRMKGFDDERAHLTERMRPKSALPQSTGRPATDGAGNPTVVSKSVQGGRDDDRKTILLQEWAKDQTDEDRKAIGNELKRMGVTPPARGISAAPKVINFSDLK